VPLEPLSSCFPKKIVTSDLYEIWHKQDPRTKEMVVIGIHLVSSVTRRSPLNEVLCTLMAKFLDQTLNSELYDATRANYTLKCEETVFGIMITVMGPRFQISSVLSCAVNIYSEIQTSIEDLPHFCSRIYKEIQTSLKKKLEDGDEIVDDIVQSLLIRNHSSIQDKCTAITNNPLNIGKLKRFVTNFQKKIYAFFYIQGNFKEAEAKSFVKNEIADKLFTSKNPINLNKTKVKSVLWPVSRIDASSVVRVDTVKAWSGDPICQLHFHCGYDDPRNMALAKIHLDLLTVALEGLEYEIPFQFEPQLKIIHGVVDFYFTFYLDHKSMDIRRETLKLQSLRSKLICELENVFCEWFTGFRKGISDSTIMTCIERCRNDHYDDIYRLKDEVSYFLDKIKFLDFNFSTLEEEERCFSKFEEELSVPQKFREREHRRDSVREWTKTQFFNEGTEGSTRKLYIFLQKSERPLPFGYEHTNPYDLIQFKTEEQTSPLVQYIYDFHAFKKKLTTMNGMDTIFEDEDEEHEQDNYYDSDEEV